MKAWKAVVAGVVIILAALYFTGRLDYTLYPLGLNLHRCARNGFGATFCGSDLTAYENRIRGVQQQIQQFAIPPIRPLPGATAQEWQVYQAALQSYCSIDPAKASICRR